MTMPNKSPAHDPARLVRLTAIRPLFANGKRIEAGESFEVQARIAADVLATKRADFANQADRWMVFKEVHVA